MTQRKAEIAQGLSDYLADHGLQGREVILYDMNPGLAFYLQLPPAFNSWISLGSYSCEKLQADLERTKEKKELPLMIVSNNFESDERVKTEVLRRFMKECGYEMKYSVGQFEMFVAE